MRKFRQLTAKDRGKIGRMHQRGHSLTEIADALGVHKSTITREMKRNGKQKQVDNFWKQMSLDLEDFEGYLHFIKIAKSRYYFSAVDAQRAANARQERAKRKREQRVSAKTRLWIRKKLKEHWSPEQIAGRSNIDGPARVSHTFIYKMIDQDRRRGGKLFSLLRRHKKKGKYVGKSEKVRIPDRTDIKKRPKIVEKRKRIGDLEGDLVIGVAQGSALVVVADRSSRLYLVERAKSKNKTEVKRKLAKIIRRMRKPVHTLTLDNGLEFWDHKKLSTETGAKVYFATPYSSWERGTVENHNGLLRQFFPKKTDFSKIKDEELRRIEKFLNHRPRKCLSYRTPFEVHNKLNVDSKKSKRNTRTRS